MIHIDRSQRRLAASLLAAALAVTSCGGGSDADDADDTRPESTEADDDTTASIDTAPPVDTAAVAATTSVAPVTDPPQTDPPVTDPPVTDPPQTDPPSTEPAQDERALFCASAEDFFIPGRALDFGDINDPFVLRGVFDALNVVAPIVVERAPSADDGALFVESQRLLDIATPGLDEVEYDLENADSIGDGAAVGQALIDFGDLLGDMQTFLVDNCDRNTSDLDERAQAFADDLANGVVPDSPGAGVPDSIATIDIESDDGSIVATVPATWSDVDGAPDGELRQLVAAPDAEAFLASYVVPGVILVSGAADTPDAWITPHTGLLGAANDEGCTVLTQEDYDDGVYTGSEATLDCGDPTTRNPDHRRPRQ